MKKNVLTLLFLITIVFSIRASAAVDVNDEKQMEAMVKKIADHVVNTVDVSAYDWNWGENLVMRGVIRASEFSDEERDIKFVRKWLDKYCVGSGTYLTMEVDDVASGFSALLVYEKTGIKKYLNCTGTAWNFLAKGSPRLPEDGTIIHNPSGQLWLDTLYMINPFAAHLALAKKDPSKFDFAANQILQNVSRSEDPAAHLSYHMWDPKKGHSPHFWGRGNGWVVMATAEVLEVLPKDHPKRQALIDLLNRRLAAIIALQDASGLWHTILDRPDSYLEVSATAMYAFAIQRGVRRGWLPESMLPAAVKALEAIAPFVQDDGTVLGVSAGTGPGDFANYQKIKTGEYTWGTGSAILAFAERADMLKEKSAK